MKALKLFSFVFLLLTALALSAPAGARGAIQVTVTNCNNATELRTKIVQLQEAQGGTLNFNCGTKTILFSAQLPLIEYDTVIDGGNKITFDGKGDVRLIQVGPTGKLTLKNVVLQNGHANADKGGGIYSVGRLILNHVTIKNSYGPMGGGAIYSNGGLDITDSVFTGNQANEGGAIYADGSTPVTTIRGSKFENNRVAVEKSGGAIFSAAAFDISTSEFVANKAGFGAAIYAKRTFLNTSGSITSSTFRENTTLYDTETAPWMDGPQVGEFVPSDEVEPSGGALYVENLPVKVTQSRMQLNIAMVGGGIYVANEGSVEIADSTLADNQASVGGALANLGQADVHSTTMFKNLSLGGAGIYNHGSTSVTNATFVGNGSILGAALYNESGSTFLMNVTMAANEFGELRGSSLANPQENQPFLALTNVLIHNSNDASNCMFGTAPAISNNNLSSDDTCNFGVGQNSVDLKLGALANNGGFTQTILPKPGSPAIDGGTSVNAPNVDQRGIARPRGGGYDVGAVEIDPNAPTVTRTQTPTRTKSPTVTQTPTRTATSPNPTCTGKPDVPMLLKPRMGKKVKASGVKLDWADTACALKYKIVIKNGAPPTTRFQKKGGLTVSEFKSNPLTAGQTYSWRVIAINGHGKAKSEWRSFTAR